MNTCSTGDVIIGGDFNKISQDKSGGCGINRKQNHKFVQMFESSGCLEAPTTIHMT